MSAQFSRSFVIMSLKILVLGVNGFIGSTLAETVLERTDWEISGLDIGSHKVSKLLGNPRFHFVEGDILINKEWIEYQIKKCDVVIPLVAIANPIQYVRDPLRVFELDFEANLEVVRKVVKYRKRILFPSTSEVYGMSPDEELNELTSPLTYGSIDKQRWIYATSKQLLDRVIFAYGIHHELDYTLFRPFNWVGPRLDNVFEAKEGSSRVFTQFMSNVIFEKPLQLVDGGKQRRSFTYVGDAIDCLMRIIENRDGKATRRIFNIGNPANDVSVAELAKLIIEEFKTFPAYRERAEKAQILTVSSGEYFGKFYQDIQRRVPSIQAVHEALGWKPTTDLRTAIHHTLAYHLNEREFDLS
jgi:nucleoside-diphosphate-sugar epimerase